MSLIHKIFRATRRFPPLQWTVNYLLRLTRRIFWKMRPAYMATSSLIPKDYLELILENIDTPSFILVEAGCGDGRVLLRLAESYPQSHFIGVDLQKSAIALGRKELEARNAPVRLICGSYLDASEPLACDYLISRAALIYLDQEEIVRFFRIRLPDVKKALILQEIVSTTSHTECSHFFAHPLGTILKKLGGDSFVVTETSLDYPPWKGARWTGANVIARRVKA